MQALIKRSIVLLQAQQRWRAAEQVAGHLLREMPVQQQLQHLIAPPQRLQILVHPEPII